MSVNDLKDNSAMLWSVI